MAATREQLKRASEKAKLSPLIGKHGKYKRTIAREERRKIFDEIVSQEFPELIKIAKAEYKLDQFIGKAPDELKLKGSLTVRQSILSKLFKDEAEKNHGAGKDNPAGKKD